MSWLRRALQWQVSPDWLDAQFGQYFCFATAPLFLVVALYALAKHPLRPAEAVIGILASVAVTLLFIVIGLLLPLAQPKPAAAGSEKS